MPTLKKSIILVDLDGTLCDNSHRITFGQSKDWDAYHSLCDKDGVFLDMAAVLFSLAGDYEVIAITGRDERYREKTVAWLKNNKLDFLIDHILMRAEKNFKPEAEVKVELLDKHFKTRDAWLPKIVVAFEDSEATVSAFRNLGIPTFQVRNVVF